MGIFIAIMIIILIAIVIYSVVKDELQALLFCIPLTILSVIIPLGVNNIDSIKATCYANIEGIESDHYSTTIYFEKFDTNGQLITIDGYYLFTMHWTDFNRYDYIDKTITIQIPEGKNFEYDYIREPTQTVIEGK